MLSQKQKDEILTLLKKEVKPALGCTEPIAVSLAVASSCELLREIQLEPDKITVEVSANIYKNGMGVGVPGTGMVGLHIASALAYICGKSEYKLEVLKDLDSESVDKAKIFLDQGAIHIKLAQTNLKLHISATAHAQDHYAKTIIENNHDSIVHLERDGEILFTYNPDMGTNKKENNQQNTTNNYQLNIKNIWDFTQEIDIKDIKFILQSVKLNKALAIEGLQNVYGLQVGRTIQANIHKNIFGNGLLARSMAMTAAASDARMAGCTLPAMSNSGSGNQGIAVTMPVVIAAEKFKSSKEELIKALTLSHLIAIHIKQHLGKLSALCGCVVATTGAACGIVMLKGGDFEQICFAIKNMIGNITGMVCDGAKVGCSLKVASGVSSAIQSAILALDNICISGNEGIIENDIEKTIQNLANIGSKGMEFTDDMILNIMTCK